MKIALISIVVFIIGAFIYGMCKAAGWADDQMQSYTEREERSTEKEE